MKKILLLLLIAPVLGFGQGEQRYADGTATDQDGNTFEWINYGTQDWAIENAEVVTYRDGTAIPQVTDATAWSNLTTGAWCYYDNDSTKGKLYNWYAIIGISADGRNLEFAPNGWRVPTDEDWIELENYLIDSGYNFDENNEVEKIAKSMASTNGWNTSSNEGAIGKDQTMNNKSGFNANPTGLREPSGYYNFIGRSSVFWTSTQTTNNKIINRDMYFNRGHIENYNDTSMNAGFALRFVRDASTASTNEYSNAITIYPNPTISIVTLQGDKEYDIEVYDMAGNKVMALTGNTIDMSHLSSAAYIVKALDKVENEEVSYKVVKN